MRQRSIDVGLATRSWGGWAWDVGSLDRDRGGARRHRGRGRDRADAALSAALVAARRRACGRLARRSSSPARSSSTRSSTASRTCLRGAPAVTSSSSRIRPGSTSATCSWSTRAAHDRRERLRQRARPVQAGRALRHAAARLHPRETRLVVAHELGHVRHHDVPRGLLYLLAGRARADVRRRAADRGMAAAPRRRAAAPCRRCLAATRARRAAVGTVSNQLSRRVERAPTRRARADRRPRDVHRLRSAASRSRTSPTPTRRAGCSLLLGHPPDDRQRIGTGVAVARRARRLIRALPAPRRLAGPPTSGRFLMPSRVCQRSSCPRWRRSARA